ncbi:hypothetical protein [Streptomyces sp. NPDC001635]
MSAPRRTVTEAAWEIRIGAEGLRISVNQDTTERGREAPGELTATEREELRRRRRLAA